MRLFVLLLLVITCGCGDAQRTPKPVPISFEDVEIDDPPIEMGKLYVRNLVKPDEGTEQIWSGVYWDLWKPFPVCNIVEGEVSYTHKGEIQQSGFSIVLYRNGMFMEAKLIVLDGEIVKNELQQFTERMRTHYSSLENYSEKEDAEILMDFK